MTDRLAEIRARLDAVTPGPWRALDWSDPPLATVVQQRGSGVHWPRIASCGFAPDADLIAHAPADIAWLLDEVERLRKEVAYIAVFGEDK